MQLSMSVVVLRGILLSAWESDRIELRKAFQSALRKLKIFGTVELKLNGIENEIGRWSEDSSFSTIGGLMSEICLDSTKSIAEGAPLGGMTVGPSGPWMSNFLMLQRLKRSMPLRVFLVLFQAAWWALKSPAIITRPGAFRTLLKKFRRNRLLVSERRKVSNIKLWH